MHPILARASRAFAVTGAAALLLAGCAAPAPIVPAAAAPESQAGYIAGEFSRTKTRGFAFVIQSADHPERSYTMSMGDWGLLPSAAQAQTVAIRIEPGRYVLKEWITYATMIHEVATRKAFTNGVLVAPFEVKAGEVVHVGFWDVSETAEYRAVGMHVRPRPVLQADVRTAFAKDYALLGALPFHCTLCVDTVALPAAN